MSHERKERKMKAERLTIKDWLHEQDVRVVVADEYIVLAKCGTQDFITLSVEDVETITSIINIRKFK